MTMQDCGGTLSEFLQLRHIEILQGADTVSREQIERKVPQEY